MRKKKQNKLLYTLILILVPVVLFAGTYYLTKVVMDKTFPSVENLKKEKEKIGYSDKDEKQPIDNYVNELPNFRAQYGNNDIMGKLEIPQLNVNTLVFRSVNNNYYLNRNAHHQVDNLGVPFFDYRNQSLNSDRQLNIYGHNTQNTKYLSQLPFTNLDAYVDKNIFDNYKNVYLSIDERKIEYEIVAVKIIKDKNNEHMKLIFYSDEDFVSHINKMVDGSLYSRISSISKDDKYLVLQACHYDPPGSYIIIICKENKAS